MANCIYCGNKIGWTEKKYNFGKKVVYCMNCMTCSICDSKATGEKRWILEYQPFCTSHYNEAQALQTEPIEKWPKTYLKAKLTHLQKRKQLLQEGTQKIMNVGKWDVFNVLFGNPGVNIHVSQLKTQNYRILKDTLETIEKEILALERLLIPQKENSFNVKESHDPFTILKLRFAKGEITKEEYKEMMNMLKSD